jgi:hypothetical protein
MSNNGNGKAVTKTQMKDAATAIEAAHTSLTDDMAFGYRLTGPTDEQRRHAVHVDRVLGRIFGDTKEA